MVSACGHPGYALAQVNLGTMYSRGQGVPQDYAVAYMWLNLAASRGDRVAQKSREGLTERMTPGQIAEGQKLSREWKPVVQTSQ